MNVLVAYASKRGSTKEIAESVAGTLRRFDLEVDFVSATEVEDLSAHDAIVLASAVYVRRWRGDARHFLCSHRRALAQKPLWVISSGPAGKPADDEAEWAEPHRAIRAVEELGAREHVVFGGRLPLEPQGLVEKAMVESTPLRFRDRRDWDEIRAWATEVAVELGA